MAAKDKFHDAVRRGLEKDGWKITHDPLQVKFGRVEMQIDLGAEQLLAASKGSQKIAVEIKSFLGAIVHHRFLQCVGAIFELSPRARTSGT